MVATGHRGTLAINSGDNGADLVRSGPGYGLRVGELGIIPGTIAFHYFRDLHGSLDERAGLTDKVGWMLCDARLEELRLKAYTGLQRDRDVTGTPTPAEWSRVVAMAFVLIGQSC